MHIVCVAVVGKAVSHHTYHSHNDQNNPLYIESFESPQQNTLKFHYIVHTALDIVEEKGTLT